jgi:16S rRNA (cytosine1402-N4)-methyltransferase
VFKRRPNFRRPPHRSTPAGQHRPVLLQEVLEALCPGPGDLVVDGTVGWAGHSSEFLKLVTPGGRLIGCDLDPENLPRARERLEAIGGPFQLHHSNFAGLATIVAEAGAAGANVVLADLGMSSMQVDDPLRGFSYSREGPLDMRMDRTRGRTAAQILATISVEELTQALSDYADEPYADRIAQAIVEARKTEPLTTTTELAKLLQQVSGQETWRLRPTPGKWVLHPAARTFQALRILVNRELANLEHLLRILPTILAPGGRAGIISFHSGEDRLVKAAFQEGLRAGVYQAVVPDPVRPGRAEGFDNPRARSAKLRWAVKA